MNLTGAAAEKLSLYDYYADACTAATATAAIDSPCAGNMVTAYLNLPAVRAAFHVSEHAPVAWTPCSDPLNDAYSCGDTLVSMVPLYRRLIARGKRLLVYSGDVDGVVPTLASRRWVAAIDPAAEHAGWRPWMADGQLAGFTYAVAPALGDLVFATVRGAGHQVPQFQGARALEMVRRWLAAAPL